MKARPEGLACAAAVLAMASGCGSGEAGTSGRTPSASCTTVREQQFVLDTAREWYLFPEVLPASVRLDDFQDAQALLDALTAGARADGRDRFFSFLTSIAAEQAFLADAQTVGFGIGLLVRDGGTRLLVSQVFEGTAAQAAGLRRGDELLAIGNDALNLTPISALLAQPGALTEALGPSTAGVMRSLRVRDALGTETIRTLTKTAYTLDPVPPEALLTRTGLTPVGYLQLRTFVSPADVQLRSAFTRFQAAGARDLIIDLRYNGGGLVATAEILASLMAGGRAGEVLSRTRFNPSKRANEETVRIRNEASAVAALRIAFLATGATASASEIVINALAPYADVAIIGAPTFGKPVGQFGFDLGVCDSRLRLVTFSTENRDGNGDYYGGLPNAGFTDGYCTSTDDLSRSQGDPRERMTEDALAWLTDNQCRPATAAQRISVTGASAPLAGASATAPYLPGTY